MHLAWYCFKNSSMSSIKVSTSVVRAFATSEIFRCTEWVLFTACACHDAHNSLKWAMWLQFDDAELLREAYVCVAAVRSSMSVLTKYLHEWLALRLAYHDEWTISKIGPELEAC